MQRPGSNAAVSVERFFELSVLGLVASGFLAVAGSGYLDGPTMWLTSAGLLLRALLILGVVRFQISERFLTVATLAYAGFFPLDYLFLSRGFLEATVHLIFFLAVMKILSARSNRDYLFTSTIAFLELLAAAILSANLNFFLFLALYLFFAMAAFTSSEIRRALEKQQQVARSGLRRFHPRLGSLTVFATLGILALTAGLFFMLPRTADAAFRHLISHRIYLPGFSNQVTLGQIGEIKTSSRPVMHIRIDSRESPANLKWRGGALAEFDGKRWFNTLLPTKPIRVEEGGAALLADQAQQSRQGTRLMYRVDLNNMDTDALFFAGSPERVWGFGHPLVLIRDANDSCRLMQFPPEGFRYEAYSLLENRLTDPELLRPDNSSPPPDVGNRYLQLPPALDGRVADLARNMAAGEVSAAGKARTIERRLRTEYGYTLDLPKQEVRDPLTYFLFTRKKGHCEYFASAMTVMLRTQGIPARLVTGFQSGVYNSLTELYVIRASDAHSWVEAWLPRRGWTTFDPTPPDPGLRRASVWDKLALYADAADTFWQQWVLAYDPSLQLTLAERMERSGRSFGLRWLEHMAAKIAAWKTRTVTWFRHYGVWLLAAAAALVLAAWFTPPVWRALHMLVRVRKARQGQARMDDATLLYGKMLELLKRRGYQKPAWFTPHEFAASLPRTEMGLLVGQFTEAYNALRFGGRVAVAPQLSHLLERLEQQR
jgi:transglutaminase-like putative cysteine protease